MRELKDYAPFYLGCECITPDGIMVLNGINATDSKHSLWFYCRWNDKKNCYLPKQNGDVLMKQSMVGKAYKYSEIKLILRPLSDMTEEEKKHVSFDAYKMLRQDEFGAKVLPSRNIGMIWAAVQTQYLLSKHFDLFGLIEAGLAIDATEIKKTVQ